MAMKFEGQGPPLLDNASQAMLAQTQLHYACYIGDGHMLDTLIGRALLHNNNDGDAMEACVAVMVSEEDAINGWTPAHWAAFYGQLTCLVKLNIKPHLGFDTPSHRSNVSPLHLAAKSGAILCLKWLLQCGASKNRQDFMGETALHKAAKSGNSDCAAMLVGHGASLSTKNHRGLTAADVAEQSNHSALAQYLRRAMEQSEYGSITQSDSPSLPISDLRNDPAYGGSGDTSHSIIMNGEEIYTSNCAKARNGIHADTEMEMEEESISEDQALSNNLENNQRLKFIGLKRSIDESGDFEHFHKRRCTVPSSRKDPSERYGDAHKTLSSLPTMLYLLCK
ncbi:hypothetical protein EGW08_017999 [Elysia chlorotica]|uniref:Uncharacterized protein n=1 Tax=Elysia chlorotica TaxID=188477 RepID=A0A3S1BT19_ELYCH|nr:hypothetical protein EGW08_017999 [Elysia chlorotica]